MKIAENLKSNIYITLGEERNDVCIFRVGTDSLYGILLDPILQRVKIIRVVGVEKTAREPSFLFIETVRVIIETV